MEEKLDLIIEHLYNLDRRDRLRTYGGFLRAMLSLIPLIIFLWSTWYIIEHGEELMKRITMEAASSAAEYTKGSGQGVLDELMKKYK